MSQRFAFQMAFQAGDIGFSGDLRQIKAVFRHADRADPLRQIVHDDPVSAHDPFTGVAVLHLFAGNVQRIAFDLDFRPARPALYFNNVN